MNNKEQVSAIQRYKIGYHTDEWGMRSGTPAGIHDASGSWVRYSDHVAVIAALRAQQLEAGYQRGYQDGYNHRDAEVQGALV